MCVNVKGPWITNICPLGRRISIIDAVVENFGALRFDILELFVLFMKPN